jgi:CheY-like chemotaxis protein
MILKIHVRSPSQESGTFLQLLDLRDNDRLDEIADVSQADIVFLADISELRQAYNAGQLFFVLWTDEQSPIPDFQPENVCYVDARSLVGGTASVPDFAAVIERHKHRLTRKEQPVEGRILEFPDVPAFDRAYSVMVVDPGETSQTLARQVLEGQREIAFAVNAEIAVSMVEQGVASGRKYDAVLVNMHLPPDKLDPSLDLGRYGLTETVPYGFALALIIAKLGVPVAVLSDADPHQDWASAMIGQLHSLNVNGQKVCFMSGIGMRWDIALKELMES